MKENKKEERTTEQIASISFEQLDITELAEVEEVITPGWGTRECCR